MTKSISTEEKPQDSLEMSANKGREAWRLLGLRLISVTPAQVMRLLLAAGAATAVGWLAWTARVALLPFFLGVVLAYSMLPIVNKLDRFLPRWFAALLTMSTVTAVIVFVLAQFVPLFIQQVYNVARTIPTDMEFEAYADELSELVHTLPPVVQPILNRWLENAAGMARTQIDTIAERAATVALRSVLGLFNALGFILGFLVIPTWLLTVLNEQKRGSAALNRMLPAAIKKDFWAMVNIVDRSLSTFVRGQFFIGLLVGVLTYFGLEIIAQMVGLRGDYNLVMAIFTGLMALVPTLGPLLGGLPVILLAWTVSQETAVTVLIMYVLIWLFIKFAITGRLEKRLINIHPAIMIIIIVAVSELGFFWVLVAAPIAGILRDLFTYVNGRFTDPPRPAGLLPYQPLPPKPVSTAAQPVPIAYRRGRAQRSAQSNR